MEKEKSTGRKRLEYVLRCIDAAIVPTGSIRQSRFLSRTTKLYDEATANVIGLAGDVMKTYALYNILS